MLSDAQIEVRGSFSRFAAGVKKLSLASPFLKWLKDELDDAIVHQPRAPRHPEDRASYSSKDRDWLEMELRLRVGSEILQHDCPEAILQDAYERAFTHGELFLNNVKEVVEAAIKEAQAEHS